MRRCFRAGGQTRKNAAQHIHINGDEYLLRKPNPIHSPVQSQSLVRELSCTAFQPLNIAAVQNNTVSGSTVSSVAPTESNGVAVTINTRKKPARPFTSRLKKRSSMKPKIAAIKGEKKRTPNAVSPQMLVLTNCVSAISGGLL